MTAKPGDGRAPLGVPALDAARVTRRELVRRGAILGGGLWIAPAVYRFAGTPAYAESPQPCPPGAYGFRLNNDARCVDIPVGNPTSCLNVVAANGCAFIAGISQSDPLRWTVRVVGVVTAASLQCDGFRTHPCVQGSPNGLGITAVDNGDGTTTVTFDCREADAGHDPPHGISHVELLFECR